MTVDGGEWRIHFDVGVEIQRGPEALDDRAPTWTWI